MHAAGLLSARPRAGPLVCRYVATVLRLGTVPWYTRLIFRLLLDQADQVYAMDTYEAQTAVSLSRRTALIRSIGIGDAFANQIRIAYTGFLRQRLNTKL